MGKTLERRTRPNPCSSFGHVSVGERITVPLPVTCAPEAMSIARISAALGSIVFAGTGRPAGYHPSTKYCRTIAAGPDAAGAQTNASTMRAWTSYTFVSAPQLLLWMRTGAFGSL